MSVHHPIPAPFPWFGGKSRAAPIIWQALGNVPNYVEPFAGSLAVLLSRPHAPKVETINDLDGFVANFWRAVSHDPDAVAQWCDWPVNEADQHARHLWLVNQREDFTARLMGDPDYYDAKIAGWWVWGICVWIGSGWCSGDGPWVDIDGRMANAKDGNPGMGVHKKRPHLGNPGMGVHKQLPHLGNPGRGVHKQLPHLGDPGMGVHKKRPHLGNPGRGVHKKRPHLGNPGRGSDTSVGPWFRALAARLRRTRVCCGDWTRVMGTSVTTKHGLTGVVLDPPYLVDAHRTADLYAEDSADVANAVREWALEHGDDPLLRIVLCGYEGEHAMPDGWRAVSWSTAGGFGSQGNGQGRENQHRERIWLSPHCLSGSAHAKQEALAL